MSGFFGCTVGAHLGHLLGAVSTAGLAGFAVGALEGAVGVVALGGACLAFAVALAVAVTLAAAGDLAITFAVAALGARTADKESRCCGDTDKCNLLHLFSAPVSR